MCEYNHQQSFNRLIELESSELEQASSLSADCKPNELSTFEVSCALTLERSNIPERGH